MEKTLVYHLYVNCNDINQKKSYKIHKECLKIFKHVFDNAIFVITVNDLKNNAAISNAVKWITDIEFDKEFDIKIEHNDSLCESKTFNDYVLKNNNLNGMVFFAHNKGSNNFESDNPIINKYSVFMWICGLYYYNLNFIEEVNGALCGKQFYPECMYGAFLMEKDIDDDRLFLANYHYAGNFYWINIDYYRQLLMLNKINDIEATNPMFSEMFPGYLFTPYKGGGLKTHNDVLFMMSQWDGKLYTMNRDEWCEFSEIIDGNKDFIEFSNNIDFIINE
jgi:hypothetical protein